MIGRTRGAVLALGIAGTLAAPAVASAQEPEPTFSCRASVLRAPLLGEPFVANPAYTPCRDDHKALASGLGIGSGKPTELTVRASALTSTTSTKATDPRTGKPTQGGAASASVAFAHINVFNLLKIDAYGLSTTAGRKCLGTQPDLGGSAAIALLVINGRSIPITAYNVNIPLGIATVRLNNVQRTASEITTRALWVDFAGDRNDIVIAESRGGATGSPCAPPPPPAT